MPFLPAEPTVLAMGIVEVLIALGLLSGWAIRVTLLLFVFHYDGKWWTAEHIKQHLRVEPPKLLRRRVSEAAR